MAPEHTQAGYDRATLTCVPWDRAMISTRLGLVVALTACAPTPLPDGWRSVYPDQRLRSCTRAWAYEDHAGQLHLIATDDPRLGPPDDRLEMTALVPFGSRGWLRSLTDVEGERTLADSVEVVSALGEPGERLLRATAAGVDGDELVAIDSNWLVGAYWRTTADGTTLTEQHILPFIRYVGVTVDDTGKVWLAAAVTNASVNEQRFQLLSLTDDDRLRFEREFPPKFYFDHDQQPISGVQLLAHDGDLFLSTRHAGTLWLRRDADGQGFSGTEVVARSCRVKPRPRPRFREADDPIHQREAWSGIDLALLAELRRLGAEIESHERYVWLTPVFDGRDMDAVLALLAELGPGWGLRPQLSDELDWAARLPPGWGVGSAP